MTIPRFHVPSVRPGAMELGTAAGHHATRVLRLEAGASLRAFDAGREFMATIVSVTKHRVLIEVGAAVPTARERGVRLRLLMSPLKGDLTELVIQKATELGVDRISPILFERTDTVARRDPGEARLERWRRVAAGAAEQSGRAVVPGIDSVQTLRDAVTSFGPATENEWRVVATEPSLDQGESREPPASVQSVLLAVGPAGGFTPADLDELNAAHFSPKRFALHTLRSETACIAALAILGEQFQ